MRYTGIVQQHLRRRQIGFGLEEGVDRFGVGLLAQRLLPLGERAIGAAVVVPQAALGAKIVVEVPIAGPRQCAGQVGGVPLAGVGEDVVLHRQASGPGHRKGLAVYGVIALQVDAVEHDLGIGSLLRQLDACLVRLHPLHVDVVVGYQHTAPVYHYSFAANIHQPVLQYFPAAPQY